MSAGTLTDAPEQVEFLRERSAVSADARLGMVQRRTTHTKVSSNYGKKELRAWRYTYGSAPSAVYSRIQTLWDDSYGGAISITVTPVDEGSSISARFRGRMTKRQQNAVRWFIQFELEEVP